MTQKLLLIFYGAIMFMLGALLSFGMVRQAQIDTHAATTVASNNKHITDESTSISTIQAQSSTDDLIKSIPTDGSFSTHSFDKTQAQALIARMPEHQLARYMKRFMGSADAELIHNKRQFAERAIEELYASNDEQPLIGRLVISDSPDFPSQSMSTTSLDKNHKLYAHLDTQGKLALGANVFIKWSNRNTGEVLLFEKKRILAHSSTNWVSYQPHDTWQVGSYDIRFYEFNDKLTPIAQLSYEVKQINP